MILLDLIIPIYNEEENIEPLYREYSLLNADFQNVLRIIFVDDASLDRSCKVIKQKFSETNFLLVTQSCRKGQGEAVLLGLEESTSKFVAILDGDLQIPLMEVERVFQLIKHKKVAAVLGYRKDRNDNIGKKISTLLANKAAQIFLKSSIKDMGCSLKIFENTYLPYFKHTQRFHRYIGYQLEVINPDFIQAPVTHRNRFYGKSNYGFIRAFAFISDLLKIKAVRELHRTGR